MTMICCSSVMTGHGRRSLSFVTARCHHTLHWLQLHVVHVVQWGCDAV